MPSAAPTDRPPSPFSESAPAALARAIIEARREAMAPVLWATVEEGRALARLHRAVVALAGRALRADTPPVDTATERRTPRLGRGLALVRGPVVEQVVISTTLDPLLSLRALASYSGLSVRKLRDCLVDPDHPLPCYRVGGKILVRRSDFDAWALRHRLVGDPEADRIASELVAEMNGAAGRGFKLTRLTSSL